MIFDGSRLHSPLALETDLCVVGSGAGGGMVAMLAAEAGLRVTLLEAGELITPKDMTQREEQMFPRLYWDSGARTSEDRRIKIHQGKGVGGSTLHNFNLCKRIPDEILRRWHEQAPLGALPPTRWSTLYDEVEVLLSVTTMAETQLNRHNELLKRGCEALGWGGGMLSHNRTGCLGSGFCELGCHYDAKNNALKVCIDRAVRAGAQVITQCRATHVRWQRGRVTGVEALVVDPESGAPVGQITIHADSVCVAASATGTPALLRRSQLPDRANATGSSLRLHPGVVAAGEWDDPVRAWQGIPQSYECTEWLDFSEASTAHRIWIVPAFAHPMATATLLPGHAAAHRRLMLKYAHIGVFSAMLHDRTCGSVEPDGELGLKVRYVPDLPDRRQLMHGLWALTQLLFSAGARRVVIPTHPVRVIERGQAYDDLKTTDLGPEMLDLTAVHPIASVPMSDSPRKAAVDSRGRHHAVSGLWIADGSLFPSSIGVPPQLSIYALGLHVGQDIVRSLARA